MTKGEKMYFSGKTDVGMKRSVNQDSFFFEGIGGNAYLIAVCDGMGGANGGNIASSLACQTFVDNVKNELSAFLKNNKYTASPDNYEIALIKSAKLANKVVYGESGKNDELKGMGTTLVSALIVDDTAFILNIGDSRAYLLFSDVIDQITHDHSYVQYLVDIGELTEEEAENNTNKNIIMKAIGIDSSVEPDMFRVEFGGDAFLLLCSDGLSNYTTEDDLKNIILSFDYEARISKQDQLDRVCRELVDTANKNGGGDNITVALYLHEASGKVLEG